jgi:hypothetical protein
MRPLFTPFKELLLSPRQDKAAIAVTVGLTCQTHTAIIGVKQTRLGGWDIHTHRLVPPTPPPVLSVLQTYPVMHKKDPPTSFPFILAEPQGLLPSGTRDIVSELVLQTRFAL